MIFEKYNNILELIAKDFKIDFYSYHGIKHLKRVFKTSQILENNSKYKMNIKI